MVAQTEILLKISADSRKATKEIKKVSKNMKALDLGARRLTGVFAGVFAGRAIISGIGTLISESKELENSLIGLSSVAQNTGQDVSFITDAAKELASDGLIPLSQVSNSLKNLLATGLDAQKSIDVFKALRQSAAFNRQGQLSLGEAIQGAAEGLKNDLSIKVDNAGITKNLSNIQKEYAASIGKTIGQLTNAEKTQAKYVGILKEAKVFQGDYNRLLDTFSGATSKAEGSTKFLRAELGNIVTQSPAVIEFVQAFSGGIQDLTKTIKENGPALSASLSGIVDTLLTTPTKFWLDVFSKGAKTAGNVSSIKDEIKKLKEETNALQKELNDNKGSIIFNSFIGRSAQVSKELADKIGLLAEKQKILNDVEKSKQIKETEKRKIDTENSFEVLQQRAINEKLKEIRLQQEEERKNIESLKKDESNLQGQEKIDNIQKQIDAENEILRLDQEAKKASKTKNQKELADLDRKDGLRSLNEKKKIADQELALEKQKIANRRSTFATIATLASSENSTLAAIGKAAGLVQIAIDTPIAVSKALAAFPPPFNFAAAGLVGTAMAAQAAKLAGISGFQDGGVLGGATTTGDKILFRGNAGEAILNKQQGSEVVNKLDERSELIEVLREFVSAPISVNIDGQEIARAVRNEQINGFQLL